MNKVSLPADVINDKSFSSRPVCGVVASAICAGVTFQQAWEYFKPIKRVGWDGPLYDYDYIRMIRSFGTELIEITSSLYSVFVGKSVAKFITHTGFEQNDNVFLVTTRNHVQIIHNGLVTDQGGTNAVTDYCHKKMRIGRIFLVVNPKLNFNQQPIKTVKEYREMATEKTLSKAKRAHQIFIRETATGKKRKEILAIITDELETTWGAASTFYHLAKKAEEANASATTETE